jgi:hypothetical protein
LRYSSWKARRYIRRAPACANSHALYRTSAFWNDRNIPIPVAMKLYDEFMPLSIISVIGEITSFFHIYTLHNRNGLTMLALT